MICALGNLAFWFCQELVVRLRRASALKYYLKKLLYVTNKICKKEDSFSCPGRTWKRGRGGGAGGGGGGGSQAL